MSKVHETLNNETSGGVDHKPLFPVNDEIEQLKRERRLYAKKLREETPHYVPIIHTSTGELKTPDQLTPDEQDHEFLRCSIDPIYCIKTYFTIFDQTAGYSGEIVPFELFPFQEELINSYRDNRWNITNKYRQAGVSTSTCAYIAWYLMFNENREVGVVADKVTTAEEELLKDIANFIADCPHYIKIFPTVKDTNKLKIYDNGCKIGAFAANANGMRGLTPTLVFWDEVAWCDKSLQFWTSAKPTLQTGGSVIFVSTPNGLDPVYYKNFNEASDSKKQSNFNAIELWWYNDPRYTRNKETGDHDLKWVKNKGLDNEISIKDEDFTIKKRKQFIEDDFKPTSSWFALQLIDYQDNPKKLAQELLCSFLGSGDNFISEEHLKRIKDEEHQKPIREEWLDKNMWIWEDPIDGEEYIISLDASSGHGEDYSTLNVFKIRKVVAEKMIRKNGRNKKKMVNSHKLEQVAEYYGKLNPQQLGDIAQHYAGHYNDGYVIVDVTGGHGTQTVDKLLEMGHDNVHYSEITHKPTTNVLGSYVKTINKQNPDGSYKKVDLIPGFMIGSNRGSILHEFERSVRMKDVTIRSKRTSDEMDTFVTVSGSRVADHKRSFHDDSLMGCAIACYVVNFDMVDLKADNNKTKKILEAMAKYTNTIDKVQQHIRDNSNTRSPDFSSSRQNPYGGHGWLFKGLEKKKR